MATLRGRTAIVTGGARGIGAATVRALSTEGAAVAVVDIDEAAARELADALTAEGSSEVVACQGDVSDPAGAKRIVDEVLRRWSHLDILVNSAGLFRLVPFAELALEDWNRIIAVNLTGPMILSQLAIRHMVSRGQGSIVNVTSIAGDRGAAGSAAYCASKGGLQMLTRAMAVEYAAHGVRVNAVAPHAIVTDMTRERLVDDSAVASRALAGIPVGRFGEPEEVAAAILYLVSDLAAYVTGITLPVNGGAAAALR